MSKFSLLLPAFCLLANAVLGQVSNYSRMPVWQEQLPAKLKFGLHDLHFDGKIPTAWDEALPLGNGIAGCLIWQKGDRLRLSIDNAYIWNDEPMQGIQNGHYSWADSTKTFSWVKNQVLKNDYAPVQKWGDEPYESTGGPTKLPVGALEFDISGLGPVAWSHLFLKYGLAEIRWKNGAIFRAFILPGEQFCLFELKGGPSPELIPTQIRVPGEQPSQPYYDKEGKLASLVVPMFGARAYWLSMNDNHWQILNQLRTRNMSPVSSINIKDWGAVYEDRRLARQRDAEMLARLELFLKKINESDSSQTTQTTKVSIPDQLIENQYFKSKYLFEAAASRPINLQAIWTADNGGLPPWRGDFHHDLNTEMSYWPAFSGNQLDLHRPFLWWLGEGKQAFGDYTKSFFECPGLNVPGVSTLAGQPMGGWIQYSMSPTISAWLAQHFYMHWRFSKDPVFLKSEAMPWFSETARFLECLLEPQADGSLKLPLSSSPEINDNSKEAWFLDWTNYDLALVRFLFEKAAELSGELKNEAQVVHYQQIAARLPDFSKTKTGSLKFAPSLAYEQSHRHFSHLMAIYPLGLLDFEHGKSDSLTIAASLADLEKYGSDWWTGYSWAWFAILQARARDGEKAADALRKFAECFVSPNGFHLNGDQCGGKYSKMTYRPFTLEGNFAFNAAVQEMLLQSHAGVIRVFPAIPKSWVDVSFEMLRAEGAFLVSAKMEAGKLAKLTILAEKGGKMRLLNPRDGQLVERELAVGEVFEMK